MEVADKKKKKVVPKATNWEHKPSPGLTKSVVERDNQIVDAYTNGVTKGIKIGKSKAIDELREKLMKLYKENLDKARDIAEDFYQFVNDKGFECSTVYMMTEGIDTFRLLFLVNQDQYLKKEFSTVYDRSIKERKASNSNSFYISMMFIPENKHTDRKKIVSDGYRFSYNGKTKK